MDHTDSFKKNDIDSDPASFDVGGRYKECESFGKDLSHIVEKQNIGLDMGDLENVIKTKRLDCPIVLTPGESTFIDVALWMYRRKRLSLSTIRKHIRYLRFMENHRVPVDFHNPSYSNFIKHMDFREDLESASAHALKHQWKAMKLWLESHGILVWSYKPPSAPKHKDRNLPFPHTVREFFYYPYSKDKYETALYQYLFQHSFLIGWRVPSEICEMKLSNVNIDSKDFGTLTIIEPKKNKSRRTIVPEPFILNSKSHKSVKNYIDKWRPMVENQKSGNALYLWPDGSPITARHLGHKLSMHGKKIWPNFQPYDCRHWCAIARLIESKITSKKFDVFSVQTWLGHDKPSTTKQYLGNAVQYYNRFKKSWIHSALRNRGFKSRYWGKHLMDLKNRVKALFPSLTSFSSYNRYKSHGASCRAHSLLQEKNVREFGLFFKLCFAVKSFSLKTWGCGF